MGDWLGTTVTREGLREKGICSGDGDLINDWEKRCFLEGREGLERWI
jgi:hypothetical protein